MVRCIRAIMAVARSPHFSGCYAMETQGRNLASPEQWARVAVDAAGPGGQFVWRVLCGLRLEWGRSPDYVSGWKIADRGDGWIRLEAASWFMTAQLVLEVDDGHLSVATFIRYDRPMAALVWPPLSAGHRFLMPGLLRHTVRVMRIAANRRSEAPELRGREASVGDQPH